MLPVPDDRVTEVPLIVKSGVVAFNIEPEPFAATVAWLVAIKLPPIMD